MHDALEWLDQTGPSLDIDAVHADRRGDFRDAGHEPVEWVYYLPLPPLFLLIFSGLYLFALPYVARRRARG